MASAEYEFLDFHNTEIAFSYKSDKELKLMHRLFSVMNKSSLVTLGSLITPTVLKLRFPFVHSLVKATIFKQFVGGEHLLDTQKVISLLHKFNTQTILDYGAESKSTEEDLDEVCAETVRAIELAASNDSVPVVSTKLTGLADNDLLIRMQDGSKLSEGEERQKEKLQTRLESICKRAYELKVGVMVDAEESWMQESIDALVDQMMEKFNKDSVIVFNTFQLYRSDKLDFLKSSYDKAATGGYKLGAKLVRGAYMDKERAYAVDKGLPQIINESKEATDNMYNAGLSYCAERHHNISVVCASHNSKSNLLFAKIIEKKGLDKKHPHLNFCQLYGMSDNLTFNLAKAGYNVAKYLPYGPINEVIPYLIRRAKENTAVTSDMSRELSLIKKELKRRRS